MAPVQPKGLAQFSGGYMPPDLRDVLKLQELIEKHFREDHQTGFYLKRLGYTLKRANALTKTYFDLSLYDLIQERLHQEAIKLLKHTILSVKQIANELNMCDPSWVGRYFTQKIGMSPKRFRQLHHDAEKGKCSCH